MATKPALNSDSPLLSSSFSSSTTFSFSPSSSYSLSSSSSSSPPPPPPSSPSSPSSSSSSSSSSSLMLPPLIFDMASSLPSSDKETLAYLIWVGHASLSSSNSSQTSNLDELHYPLPIKKLALVVENSHSSTCTCFCCYLSFWGRWNMSPNRELIHRLLDLVEEEQEKTKKMMMMKKKRAKGKMKEEKDWRVYERKRSPSKTEVEEGVVLQQHKVDQERVHSQVAMSSSSLCSPTLPKEEGGESPMFRIGSGTKLRCHGLWPGFLKCLTTKVWMPFLKHGLHLQL